MSRNRPLDLNALQTFAAFCEAGSMTAAAAKLGVSQSAVSQLIKRLEQDAGGALIDRDARPAQLTSAGRTLLELSRDLLSHAQSVTERVRQGGLTGHPQIRLGCVDSFAATVGPSLIRALSQNARELRMWSGLTPDLVAQLTGRELDMAICTDAAVTQHRLSQKPLFAERFVLVVPRAFAQDACPELASLNVQLPLIRYSLRSVIGQQAERYLRHRGLYCERRFEFDATDPLLSLVAAGLGWALSTPLCLWQARHFIPEVAVFPLPGGPLAQREFFLLEHRGEWQRLSDDIIRMTRQVMQQHTLPGIRQALPGLKDDVFNFFD